MQQRKIMNERLRRERELRGWSLDRAADELFRLCGERDRRRGDINANMIHRWEMGIHFPSPYYREKLCQLYGKNAAELGLLLKPEEACGQFHCQQEQSGDLFQFGPISSTYLILDGDGQHTYSSRNIRCHFRPIYQELPPDLEARRREIQQQQDQARKEGKSFFWNGDRFYLDRFIISREGLEEELALDLWFGPSDYYTFLATNMSLNDPVIRSRYISEEWDKPPRFFSNAFGVYLLVITRRNEVILTRRGMSLGSRPLEFNVSMCEGLSFSDADPSGVPDLYHCATRGLAEELGLIVSSDFSSQDIHFLSFGVDAKYVQFCLLGFIKVACGAEDLLRRRRMGVKDRMENQHLSILQFDPQALTSFVLSRGPWAPAGLACLYHCLVYEFGREAVDRHLAGFNP
jgi:transcriptional regulator with XRE-family HTH domain